MPETNTNSTPQINPQTPQNHPHKGLVKVLIIFAVAVVCYTVAYLVYEKFDKPIRLDYVIEANPTTAWQTYRNDEFGFEFKYPEDWKLWNLVLNPNESFDEYDLAVDYISAQTNATRGQTYCEANISQSERCEFYNDFNIDWEFANAIRQDSKTNAAVAIRLSDERITESREILRQILSTFRFISVKLPTVVAEVLESDISYRNGQPYIKNQLDVTFKNDVSDNRILEIVRETGAKVIGGIPEIKTYEFQYGSIEEYDSLIQKRLEYEAYIEVESAT